MIRWLKLIVLTFAVCCTGKAQYDSSPVIEGELLVSDLNQLKSALNSYHAGLLWYRSNQEWDRLFDRARQRAKNGQTYFEFFREVSKIVAATNCGHTRAWMSDPKPYEDSTFTLPIRIKFIEGEPVVHEVHEAGTGLRRGDKIVSINGLPMDDLIHTMMTLTASDGLITTGKIRFIEKRFPYLYPLLINPDGFLYKVQYSTGKGEVKMTELHGVLLKKFPVPLMKEDFSLLKFYALNNVPNTYYMSIRTFVNNFFDKEGLDYFKFLDRSFAELKKNGAKHLVIDLRGNGGGDDGNGAELLSYLAGKPFQYYRKIEVTNQYAGWGEVQAQEEGPSLMVSHPNLSFQEPKKNRFDGEVYILIDGESFSATAEFGALAHHLKLATFVGEETGGGYQGNTSGPRKKITLDNTGISASIPLWRYLVAVDESPGHFGRGVIPDYAIQPTVKDYLSGNDAVLDYSLLLIKRSL